ncbi:MAG TPA: N-acetylmuramic acid 6-phosphate etherase [Terriglobales bacterium]|nr:N-acetylmuramic acid 6-phosphate etherase [Terriglobales bacterium]
MKPKRISSAVDLARLETERPNKASSDLDTRSALEIAGIINAEDKKVAVAVGSALPQIARAIETVRDALRSGGRLIYVGAGTSGRIAALDAVECPPTFNVSPKVVQYVIAGGVRALGSEAEASEDSREAGRRDLGRLSPTSKDVVIGIAASGRTPYTLAAIEYARRKDAKTAAIVCNPGTPLEAAAEVPIVIEVGPEVVSGSTRMKAGTAQKLVCNMITTGAMVGLGYVYGNLMVNVRLKNKKLLERGISILQQAAGIQRDIAIRTLRASGRSLPVALVMLKAGISKQQAQQRLKATRGNVRQAIDAV